MRFGVDFLSVPPALSSIKLAGAASYMEALELIYVAALLAIDFGRPNRRNDWTPRPQDKRTV